MGEIKQLEKVKSYEIGFFIKVILLDYRPSDNQELADLITEHFEVDCTKEDIDNYQMVFVYEDYEKVNRIIEYDKKGIRY